MQDIVKFKYLGVGVSTDIGMEEEMTRVLHEGRKICESLMGKYYTSRNKEGVI